MKESVYHHIYKIWLLSQIAELESFKKVSVHCGMTQSALSQNLKSLEGFLGKTLLIREKGSISLTTEGKDLLDRFNPILSSIGEEYQVTSDLSLNKSKLSIGAYDSIAVNILPQFFPRLHRKYPDLKLDIQTSRSASLASSVRRGELDMALVTEVEDEESMNVTVLAEDRFGVFVSRRHAISEATFEEMASLGVATISPGPSGYPRYYQKFLKGLGKELGDEPPIVMTSDSFETVRSVCLSGEVAGIMPYSVAQRVPGEFRPLVKTANGGDEEHSRANGSHSICLISRKNTDPRLRELILLELNSVLSDHVWGYSGESAL